MPNQIDSFSGVYSFLSNFHPSPIKLEGILYPSVEHAYQATKTLDMKTREIIAGLPTAGQAKKAGRAVKLRNNWEDIKENVMEFCLREKFNIRQMGARLVRTGDLILIEGNHWGDTYWGVCGGVGQNRLGILLMKVREELIKNKRLWPTSPNW